MFNKTLILLISCVTAGTSAMAPLTFTTPAEALAAIPAGVWTTSDQKDLVIAICRRMVNLAQTNQNIHDIAQYIIYARTLQARMETTLDQGRTYIIAHKLTTLREEHYALAHPINNFNMPARRHLDFSAPGVNNT